MKTFSISTNNYYKNAEKVFGYSYAYEQIEKNLNIYLKEIGVDLNFNDPNSKTQLYLGEPPGLFHNNQYKILMAQWESTLLPPEWPTFIKDYDEVWTANNFGKQAFLNSGVPEDKVYVYEHGVDSNTWKPALRGTRDKIRFLHIDSGTVRKRADLAKVAFKNAFGDNENYELTLKYTHFKQSEVDWNDNNVLEKHGEWEDKNIRHVYENMSIDDLVKMYHFHDILIYPSEGEGFGLIPLQALATGMPVISTGIWCSYERFLNGNVIDSKLGPITTQESYERFGEAIVPDVTSMTNLMIKVAADIKEQSQIFINQVPSVISEYNWYTLSKGIVDNFIDRKGLNYFKRNRTYII